MIKKAIKPRNQCKTKIPPPLKLLELKGNKLKSSLNQHKTLKFRYMVKGSTYSLKLSSRPIYLLFYLYLIYCNYADSLRAMLTYLHFDYFIYPCYFFIYPGVSLKKTQNVLTQLFLSYQKIKREKKSAHVHIMIKLFFLFQGQPFLNFLNIARNKRLIKGKLT